MKLDCFDLDGYLLPIWESKEIYQETLTFVGEEDEAPLLYKPTELFCVRNFGLNEVYKQGEDYLLTESGKIKRLKGSKMPFFETDEFYLKNRGQHAVMVVQKEEGVHFDEVRYFAFGEKDFMTSRQITVSYRHEEQYAGKIPPCKKDKLPQTYGRLVKQEKLRIAFYGDSIIRGANASGLPYGGEVAPYMKGFDEMMVRRLEHDFGADIEMFNGAVGGWTVTQGKEHFAERIEDFIPDLMVIGFGMNGSKQELSAYKADVLDIIRQARLRNSSCEFVLLGTTLPNPSSTWMNNQPIYVKALYEIEKEIFGVAVSDMTEVHQELLRKKRYRDMTGNNVNHPNDFLIRVYAQVLLQTIAGCSQKTRNP